LEANKYGRSGHVDIADKVFGFGCIETLIEGELGDPSVVDTPRIDWDYPEV